MQRYLFVICLIIVVLPGQVVASPLQLAVGLPSTFSPGQPLTFEVRLPGLNDLGSYNIDLLLDGDVGTAGIDFFFDTLATMPAATNYVFPSSVNFFDAVNADSPTRHRITLTDFSFVGANVIPASNDRIATIVLQTLPTFHGKLSLSVDTAGLILDTPAVISTPIVGFDSLRSSIAESGPTELSAVPEPVSHLYYCLTAIVAVIHRRASRAAHLTEV